MQTKPHHQRNKGQALAEGAAFLLILIPIIVGGILLNLVTSTLGYYHLKLAQVADAGARVAAEERYWLGAQRPDFNPSSGGKAWTDVQNTCGAIWTQLHMPGSLSVTPDFSSTSTVTVKVVVNSLPIFSGGFLPAMLSMQDTAVEPYSIQRPVGVMGLTFDYPGGVSQGIYMPSYGAGAGSAGPSAYPDPTACGANFPYWETGVASPSVPMCPPSPYTNTDSGGPWTSY